MSALELQDGTEGESDGNKRKTPPEEQNAKKRKKSNDNVQKATGGGGFPGHHSQYIQSLPDKADVVGNPPA